MKNYNFYFYILASESGTLYCGVTKDMEKRIMEHKSGAISWFTKKYDCKKLVYIESTSDIQTAIAREKQIKSWGRKKKEHLIHTLNPTWKDLSTEWFS